MKLSAYAKKVGIHYRTAYSHFRNGTIPGAYRLSTGTIIVPDDFSTKVIDDPIPQPACSNKHRPVRKGGRE